MCKSKCRFISSVCNNKQHWNEDKCRCECKELINEGVCDKGFIWNPSHCECQCYKSCDFSEYLDYKNCKGNKRLVNKLVERSSAEKCTGNVDEKRRAKINSTECNSVEIKCTLYIVLL